MENTGEQNHLVKPLEKLESSETSIGYDVEKEKKSNISIGFLFDCHTVDSLAERLNLVIKNHRLDAVMLDEYDLSIEDVNTNLQRISGMAKEKKVDIILAADNKHRKVEDKLRRIPWETRRKEIKDSGAILLDEGISEEEVNDSVGYYFGKDGEVFAFPKTWEHPIHPIPGTKTAVAICGEIGYLRPERIKDLNINLIYNPSREGDDPFLKYRMIGLATPNLTDEGVHAQLMMEEGFRSMAEGNEERKHNYQYWFDKIKVIAQDDKDNPSIYVRNIKEILSEKGIAVIRSDGEKNSGLLNPIPGMKVSELEYQPSYAKMSLSFGQK